jgi:hypothetical protein
MITSINLFNQMMENKIKGMLSRVSHTPSTVDNLMVDNEVIDLDQS